SPRQVLQGAANKLASMFLSALAASILDQDSAHGLGRGREEVPAAVPGLLGVVADKAEICLMDQGGGLQGLPRLLLGQTRSRQLAKFIVDQRQELLRGVWVAVLDLIQNPRNFAHGVMIHRQPASRDCRLAYSVSDGRSPRRALPRPASSETGNAPILHQE